MPKIRGHLAKIDFKISAAEKFLRAESASILRDGARAWVEAIKKAVPVWSGMAAASIKPIADLVGVPFSVSPVAGVDSRVSKGQAQGDAKFEIGPNKFVFEWSTTVFHYLINEFHDVRPFGFNLITPPPWFSVRKAEGAFYNEVNPRLSRLLIRTADFIKTTRTKIG